MNIKEWEELELTRKSIDIEKQELVKNESEVKRKLNIVYIMVWTKVCGGSKIILEYANRLSNRGHNVTIVTYDKKPQWFNLEENINFIKVPNGEDIKIYIPECDLIVATSWKCIYEAVKSNKAPVVFFEQGGSHLFEAENLDKNKLDIIKQRISLASFVYTVSGYAKEKMLDIYNKNAKVICNAVDSEIFFEGGAENHKNNENIEIAIIGSEDFKFKNIGEILEAYRILEKKYNNISLNWITQTKPTINQEKAIVNPPQQEIGEILRRSDIYVCNSEYESFGLPTLEAMTCGTAIITTDTGGMRDFVRANENGLIVKKHDVQDLVQKIEILINDKALRQRLAYNGLKTAKKMSWDVSVDQLVEYYREIAKYKIKE